MSDVFKEIEYDAGGFVIGLMTVRRNKSWSTFAETYDSPKL